MSYHVQYKDTYAHISYTHIFSLSHTLPAHTHQFLLSLSHTHRSMKVLTKAVAFERVSHISASSSSESFPSVSSSAQAWLIHSLLIESAKLLHNRWSSTDTASCVESGLILLLHNRFHKSDNLHIITLNKPPWKLSQAKFLMFTQYTTYVFVVIKSHDPHNNTQAWLARWRWPHVTSVVMRMCSHIVIEKSNVSLSAGTVLGVSDFSQSMLMHAIDWQIRNRQISLVWLL